MKDILITGYYNKQNTGDDLFEKIAKVIFKKNNYFIESIDTIRQGPLLISKKYDSIILFGGETFNEYFLKPLSIVKEFNQNIKLYALGVGLGANIESLQKNI